MAANTKENREQVADLIVGELNMIVSDRRKATVPVLRAALKLLSVYREDHACTNEDCEECEIVLDAERALGFDSDSYGSFIIEYVKNQLIHQWDQCDDSWNDATDRVVGMIYGEPFGGE